MYVITPEYNEDISQPRIKLLFADDYLTINLGDFWHDIKTTGLENEGGVKLTNGKKPEELIRRLIDLITNTNDMVMDFFLGSGTTCGVAHKMGRRYIGIEQLDYGENDSVVRLNNVINGDQSGISKNISPPWQGGGSFVYTELMELNEKYISDIKKADTSKELLNIYGRMRKEAFFRYTVDLSGFKENDFSNLSITEQKRVLIECLDKNHLYVNYGEIEDATYKVSAEDKKLNKEFYATGIS